MIGLDTNVFILYIVQDDEQQAQLATDVIENQCSVENPAFINEITLYPTFRTPCYSELAYKRT